MKRPISSVLTAPAGTGKSYMVVADLVDNLLPMTTLRVLTNIGFGLVPSSHSSPPAFEGETFLDRIAGYVNRVHGLDVQSVCSRIGAIPAELLAVAKAGGGDVAGHLEAWDVAGALIILDEAHNFIGSKHSKESKKAWQDFVGELRHRGASIQFITQHPGKLAVEVINEAGSRQALVDAEEERDPFFGVQLYYWYELRAKLLGRFESCFVRIDLRDIDGKKTQRSNVVRVKRRSEIFALYDSASAPEAGGVASSALTSREWERRSWPSLLGWFLWFNGFSFVRPVVFGACLFGGVVWGQDLFSFGLKWFSPKQKEAASRRVAKVDGVAPVPVTDVSSMKFEAEEEERSQERVMQLEAELVAARAVVESYEALYGVLTMLAPDGCAFGDGLFVPVGERVAYGPHAGKMVNAIDWRRRSVSLDGQWVRMGEARNPAGLGSPLSASAGGSGGGGGESVAKPSHSERVGLAPVYVGPGDSGSIRGERGNASNARFPVSNVGSLRSADQFGSGGDRAAVGDRSNADR